MTAIKELMDEPTTILAYEIGSALWVKFIWWNRGQELVSEYFACKVARKYKRYLKQKPALIDKNKEDLAYKTLQKNGLVDDSYEAYIKRYRPAR